MTNHLVFENPDGVLLFEKLVGSGDLAELSKFTDLHLSKKPGYRLTDPSLGWLLDANGPIGRLARRIIGSAAQPIKSVLFNKTVSKNWITPWHQDRAVPMREKKILQGYETWSEKEGVHHVEPPFRIIENMITIKVLLDDCGPENGPIKIAAGSHHLGKLKASEVAEAIEGRKQINLVGKAGDVWVHAGSSVHSSNRSQLTENRRILHVDYSAEGLPDDLNWLSLA
ncbi:MAG: phytanoyl-CoA dioxygenase family protein [Kordiimonadaceae bacterium]|nr:phytanoyl-CoA dioxygenase family protein [Kordiimonadaceae bacterium]MBO6567725.1 phytanoyl-CoA dioxygenase family protein [Kordiimonadaceae bacterium]MBO6963060.1 phytanoyl-CoA dioxygenase family protein [Kordiimonadaceae bacterium]